MNNLEKHKHARLKLVPGIRIVLGIAVLFAGLIWWKQAHYPHQIKQLAEEFSRISIIQTRPVLNHAGTLVGIIHTTEHGVGVFVADIKTRTERKLCEIRDSDYDAHGTDVFGWSPDDKTFAFSWNQMLLFWTGDGNKAIEETISSNGAELFAWLSPDSCASVDSLPVLHLFKFDGGHWHANGNWPLANNDGPPRAFVAMGTNSVAWQTGKAIWQMNFDSGEMKRCYSVPKGDIVSMSYSKFTDEFLLVVNTNRATASSLLAVSRTAAVERPVAPDRFLIRQAQWINKGHGYVCRAVSGDTTLIMAKAGDGTREKSFFRRGGAESLFCDGEDSRFYAFAAATNEPPGMWKCEADKGDVDYVYPPWGNREVQVHYQPVLTGYAPYANHNAKYALVPPANFSRHKKYSLVIGLASYQWTPIAYATYAQCLAQSGAFAAFTGLTFGAEDETRLARFHAHTNNILAIYNQLTANPSIDQDRVYLFAFSQSTLILNDLVRAYPGRWRGIILLNPGGDPENLPRDASLKNVLATAGTVEPWSWRRFSNYQTELCKLGVPMEWHIRPDSSHFERAQSTLRERTLLMADMVFDGQAASLSNIRVLPNNEHFNQCGQN